MNLIKAGGLALVSSALIIGTTGVAANAHRRPHPSRSCAGYTIYRTGVSGSPYTARVKAMSRWNSRALRNGYRPYHHAIYKRVNVVRNLYRPWLFKATVSGRPCGQRWALY